MEKIWFTNIEFLTPEYDACISLRNELLRKPLNLEFTEESLELEADEFHFGIFNHYTELIACLSLKPLSLSIVKMRQVAVSQSYQGRGVGRYLIEASENWMRNHNINRVELNARDTALDFYLKLNYKIDGQMFKELNIPHWKMIKILDNAKN